MIGGLVALLVVRMTGAQNAKQAAKTRQNDAIADFVAAIWPVALNDLKEARDSQVSFSALSSAQTRLELVGGDGIELATALKTSPHRISRAWLSIDVVKKANAVREDAVRLERQFRSLLSRLCLNLADWPNASQVERLKHVASIALLNEKIENLAEEARKLASESAEEQ